MATRKLVNPNLVNNGDFESGSVVSFSNYTSNDTGVYIDTAYIPTSIDSTTSYSGSKSLKLLWSNAGGHGGVFVTNNSFLNNPTGANGYGAIPVLPSTQYILSAYISTNNIAAGRPILMQAVELNGAHGTVATNNSTSISGTNGFTLRTITFTTNSVTTSVRLFFYNDYSTTADRNINSFANIDDITFYPTTPTTRLTAGTRLTASTRMKVRDFGTALSLDGTNFVTVASNPAFNTSVFTYTAWIKLSSSGGVYTIKGNQATTGPQFRVNAGKLNLLKQTVADIGSSNTVLPLRTWIFVAVSYDASGNAAFYLNGVSDGVVTSLQTFSFGSIQFGSQSSGSESLVGLMDEPRIFSAVLTPSQIANIYYNGVVPTSGLAAEYLFNESSGTIALDSSGNGNNGTITGATYTTDVPMLARQSA